MCHGIKSHQVSCLLEVLPLERPGGAERPAGAAAQLVLDGRHVPLLPPVLVLRGVLGVTARVESRGCVNYASKKITYYRDLESN